MTKERELLRRALDYIDQYDSQGLEVYEEIETYLAVEPEAEPFGYVSQHKVEGPFEWQFNKELVEVYPDTALSITPVYLHPPRPAEPEAEPVKFLCDATRFKVTGSKAEGMIYGLPQNLIGKWVAFVDADNGQHLKYTRPDPARKPMTEEEIDVGFNPYRMRWLADDQYFVAGVRFAEKHHGIGGSDTHEWQGLTDEDRLRLKNYWKQPGVGVDELADAIEQALQEKNP